MSSALVLVAAGALGIGAASFASGYREWVLGTGTGFFAERVWGARREHNEQRYSGKPDGDSRNAQDSIHNS